MDNRGATDAELLDAWAAGDRDCGDTFIERYFDVVYRFFGNKVVHVDVEDLVQQTFVACLEARSRYDARAKFATFLLGIARNQLYTYYRKRRREPSGLVASSVRDLATSPTGAVARLEDERLLLEALRNVPIEAQVVLELAYLEGLTGDEIAEVLGIARNAVHVRLHRARENLRESLRELAPDRVALAEDARRVLARDMVPRV